jgi:hypothetical protein
MLDTTRVQGRRTLRFATLDDLLSDARGLVAGEKAGRVRRLGNWSVGTALNHLAAWIEYQYVGYPSELLIPEEMKANARAIKHRLMTEPMRPGEKLPGLESAGGTLGIEEVSAAVGLARLEAAVKRLKSGDPPVPDPAFGLVTAREWTEMTLRHAELHLSFQVVENP